jgi:hypothetical protein
MLSRVYLCMRFVFIGFQLPSSIVAYPKSITRCFSNRFMMSESELVDAGVRYLTQFIDIDDIQGLPFQKEYVDSLVPLLKAYGIPNPKISDLARFILSGDLGDWWMLYILPHALKCHLVMTRIYEVFSSSGVASLRERALGVNVNLHPNNKGCFAHMFIDDTLTDGALCMLPEEVESDYPDFHKVLFIWCHFS